MGSAHGKFPDIRPTQPVAAIIKERLPRSVLLRSARANSLLVAAWRVWILKVSPTHLKLSSTG